MKKLLSISIFLMLTAACGQDSDPKIKDEAKTEVSFRPERVLFIGNSHTNYNGGLDTVLKGFLQHIDLPYTPLVQRMALDGYSMEDHAEDINTLSKIEGVSWNVLVLQENSSLAANESLQAKLGIEKLSLNIKDDATKIFLFMTWAYENQPGMLNGIKSTYEEIAPLIYGNIVPVGVAFNEIINDPENVIPLFSQDGIHTSPEGTFLAAAMFYQAIYDKDPTENTFDGGLEHASAVYLKTIAKQVMSEYNN